jgi:hypothetical protein
VPRLGSPVRWGCEGGNEGLVKLSLQTQDVKIMYGGCQVQIVFLVSYFITKAFLINYVTTKVSHSVL